MEVLCSLGGVDTIHLRHLPFVSLEDIEEIVHVRLLCTICGVFFGERQYIFLSARPSRRDSVGVS